MVLRVLSQLILKLGEKIALTFVDYTAAFDTCSHKFIDRALEKAGVSIKCRAMFRAVYSAATAYTTVPSADGSRVESAHFRIGRGVLQGDVTSPLYFILALELILLIHDAEPVCIPFADLAVHTLAYADDLTLAEYANPSGIARSSKRATAIAAGSKNDADM